MYANLRVTLTNDEELYAWQITPAADRSASLDVHTDENDGQGNYADPGPIRTVPIVEVKHIAADW